MSNNNNNNPNPCPHCDSTDSVYWAKVGNFNSNTIIAHYVYCYQCAVRGESGTDSREALNNWNSGIIKNF